MLLIPCDSRVKSCRNRKDPQRIIKIEPFIDKYKWEGTNYPSEEDDWKNLRKMI